MSTPAKPLSLPQLFKALGLHLMEHSLKNARVICGSDAQFEVVKGDIVRHAHVTILEGFQQLLTDGYAQKCPHCTDGAITVELEAGGKTEQHACMECAGIGIVNGKFAFIREHFVSKETGEPVDPASFVSKVVGDES